MGHFAIPTFACVMLVCFLTAPVAESAITCGMVVSSLSPCISYLQKGGAIPGGCCSGVSRLNGAARTTPDRQTACRCLQNAARGIPGLKMDLAASLPKNCRVNIPYKISLSTDCNKVK